MKLLDVVNINDCERIFECNSTRTYYKMENNELLFRKESSKGWARSVMTVGRLREYDVEEIQEEIQEGRKKSRGEIYYYIDEMGNVIEDTEEFASLDDDRYEFGNYFESKEEAEECRELIIKTIKAFKINRNKEKEKACKVLIEKTLEAFKGRNMSKREREEELEKEFEDIESIEISKYYGKIISLNKNYTSLEDFENKKDCLYIDVNGRNIALSMEDWEKLNQYVEKLRKFK